MVTPVLFQRFPTPQAMSQASLDEVESIIRSTGFYRNKAKSLIGASKALVEQWQGRVPKSLESLQALPGVGRKTANVVLGNSFGIASGIVVDTHVSRLSQRLGWTRAKSPEKIEEDLLPLVPKEDWIIVSHLLIFHGRKICKARSPLCPQCSLNKTCPQIGLGKKRISHCD